MTQLLEKAGASFLRAFLVTLLFLSTGILNAPDGQTAWALSVAALAAGIAAGLKAAQVIIPFLTWAGIVTNKTVAALLDSFSRAFVGVFVTFWIGWLAAPDWSTWKSAGLAAVIAAATAGARALQGLFTEGEQPSKGFGL